MVGIVIQAVVCATLLVAGVMSGLTPDEIQEILDVHNNLRRNEGASDMQIMTWDDELARSAQNWSAVCAFKHGNAISSSTLGQLDYGQNMYATTASSINLSVGVKAWFDEKQHYDYDTRSCENGHVCGHYTQVVWSTTNRVGCGYTHCHLLADIGWTESAFNFVCNYSPGGNIRKKKPYKKGDACTKCKGGQYFCNQGLCDSSCSGPDVSDSCECNEAACKNCATATSDCRCQCATGWTGDTCSRKCKNYSRYCGRNPGWPKFLCTDSHPQVLYFCPKFCEICDPGTPSECN